MDIDKALEPCKLHCIPAALKRSKEMYDEWVKYRPAKKKVTYSKQLAIAKAVKEGMTYNEVAKLHKISISTVKQYKDVRAGRQVWTDWHQERAEKMKCHGKSHKEIADELLVHRCTVDRNLKKK